MKHLIFVFVLCILVGCSPTQKRYEIDPCQLEIKHPDILRCLERKAVEDYYGKTLPDYETALCDCKKEFFSNIKIGE